MNLSFSEWQTQRFLSRCIIARRNELQCLQKEANNSDKIESNRFLGLTIIEVIAKNWWFQYEPKQIEFINDPANRFNDAIKEELAEDLITDMSWIFQYIVDLWREMHSITTIHEEIIYRKMVKKLFDPREPGLTTEFLFQNKILKRF